MPHIYTNGFNIYITHATGMFMAARMFQRTIFIKDFY